MENGYSPPDTALCGRCGTDCDLEDNFCRNCGLALHDPQLPAVRDERHLPAVWRPQLPAVVRGVTVVAVGTIAEVMVRRLVRSFINRGRNGHSTAHRAKGDVVPHGDAIPDDTQMVSETLLLRRVRFRR